MNNLGSEVGHKMRSAVKAKLIELGSGTSAGYIDDELPDYVMIMVANKRSKSQMMDDLSLFLGKHTEMFVNWLHQVLEKLQQVTLPATAAIPKTKRKVSESTDKKDKKKKKLKRNVKEKTPDDVRSTTPPPVQPKPSITDVFADHLIQRAKKSLKEVEVKKKEEPIEAMTESSAIKKSSDGFDIPTITEIAKNAVTEVNRRKEITELAELQRKIDEAKKQLRHMAPDESEDDEDFLNLRADGDDIEESSENVPDLASKAAQTVEPTTLNDKERPKRVSITFGSDRIRDRSDDRKRSVDRRTEDRRMEDRRPEEKDRRSVLERLGTRPIGDNINNNQSTQKRSEQKMYVPVYRRNEQSQQLGHGDDRDNDRSREKTRENLPRDRIDFRERVRERERDRSGRVTDRKRDKDFDRNRNIEAKKEKASTNNNGASSIRIGSRVCIAPPKPEYNEDVIEVPVNSVVKVQPRPTIPKRNQACKNLLLRAMAEAQQSIAAVKLREYKPRELSPRKLKPSIKQRLNTGSFMISFQNNEVKRNLTKDNIIVEVPNSETAELEGDNEDEEYCPVPTNTQANDKIEFEYIPQSMSESYDDDEEMNDETPNSTQFVVTLDARKFQKRKKRFKSDVPSDTPDTAELERSSPPKKGRIERVLRSKAVASSPLRTDIGQKVNKLIIRNDTEDEEELRKDVEMSIRMTTRKRRNVSPIRFDLASSELKKERRKSSDGAAAPEKSKDDKYNKPKQAKSTEDKFEKAKDDKPEQEDHAKSAGVDHQKIRTSTASSKKYENLPSLASTITAVSSDTKIKPKEKCKYYPICGKGDRCEFYHPATPCKAFPTCKFGDNCLYIHPKCKFDLTCSRLGCNFLHTPVVTAAPPLSSQVVPVSNYKKIIATPLPALCRFYPQCSNTICEFYHPKPCKFGKNCTNKVECNFYHFELPSKNKLKWVASTN